MSDGISVPLIRAKITLASDGTVTALFHVTQSRDATQAAILTRDGVTATGTTPIRVGVPEAIDRAALMLSNYVWPAWKCVQLPFR